MDMNQNNKKVKEHQDDDGELFQDTRSGMKRKSVRINDRQKNKRIKKHQNDDGETVVDLPDIAVYKILSLFTTGSGSQFRTISKQWNRLWYSLPVIDLDEFNGDQQQPSITTEEFKKRNQKFMKETKERNKNFMNFVGKCFKLRGKDNFAIERFRLRMRYFLGAHKIHQWLRFSLNGNLLQELDLNFYFVTKTKKHTFHLERDILNGAKSLTILKLENLIIDSDSIDLPSLKTMSLKSVVFTSCSALLSGCPLIEHLFLSCCTLTSPSKISSPCLKSLQIMGNTVCSEITKLKAASLESLRIHCLDGIPFIKDFSHGKKLKSLELGHSDCLRSSWFENLDSRFPLLESLTLHQCNLEELEELAERNLIIRSQHLKRFQVCFCFSVLKLSTMFPNLLEAVFVIIESARMSKKSSRAFDRIMSIERNYCPTKTSLHVAEAEDLIFPASVRTSPPPFPLLENLEVNICNSTVEDPEELMDSLHWMAPSLKSPISIKQNSSRVYNDYSEEPNWDFKEQE